MSVVTSKHTGEGPGKTVDIPVLFALLGFSIYLLWGTGFATDDYVHLFNGLTRPVHENWWPKEYVSIPILHYTHGLAYYLFGDNLRAYDLLKAFYAGLGVYFSSRFFLLFCAPRQALMLGFLFVFLPLHDAATFWLTGLYLVLSFSCYLFAYVQGAAGRYRWAILFAALGSFSSYGSPPIAFGLALLALMQRRLGHAAALLVPNLIYILYYLVTSLVLKSGTPRLTGDISLVALGMQMLLQLATFVDSAVGPSGLAKLYFSIASLDSLGLVLGLFGAIALPLFVAGEARFAVDRRLLVAATAVLFGSFGMFALTGLYPQLAFNLGDRIMIYGGFFLVCLMAVARLPRWVEMGTVLVLCLAISGVSSHWKRWNQSVERVAANIRAQEGFRTLAAGTRLYISGHQYSKLGPYSHIEFFTADYVVQTFFMLQLGSNIPFRAMSFNRRLVFEEDILRDRKYGDSAPVAGGIWLYDSERNTLEWITSAEISARLRSLPDETRHWTQQLGDGWLKTRLLEAVPRLRYAY
jgi:hypothetical protein